MPNKKPERDQLSRVAVSLGEVVAYGCKEYGGKETDYKYLLVIAGDHGDGDLTTATSSNMDFSSATEALRKILAMTSMQAAKDAKKKGEP